MIPRLPALLLAAALASGCAAVRRGADDGVVVATTPIHLLTTPGHRFAAEWRRDPLSASARAPFLVPMWILADGFFTGVSAADLALTPAYVPWDVHRPDLYATGSFPPRLRDEVMESAGEGAAWTAVLAAPIAGYALTYSGKGSGSYPPGSYTLYP